MTIKTITLDFGTIGNYRSVTFILNNDFDVDAELKTFKKENRNERLLFNYDFVEFLISRGFISKLPCNKTFVVGNDFYINNEMYVGED